MLGRPCRCLRHINCPLLVASCRFFSCAQNILRCWPSAIPLPASVCRLIHISSSPSSSSSSVRLPGLLCLLRNIFGCFQLINQKNILQQLSRRVFALRFCLSCRPVVLWSFRPVVLWLFGSTNLHAPRNKTAASSCCTRLPCPTCPICPPALDKFSQQLQSETRKTNKRKFRFLLLAILLQISLGALGQRLLRSMVCRTAAACAHCCCSLRGRGVRPWRRCPGRHRSGRAAQLASDCRAAYDW